MLFKKLFNRAIAVSNWLKKNRKLLMLLLAIVTMLILGGCLAGSHHVALAVVVAGVAGGKHIDDEPLTTDLTRNASPDLLLNEIDQQIVKIRPMATPIDQLSRCAGSKHVGSMIVDYYNVDTKPTSAEVADDYVEPDEGEATADDTRITLSTSNDDMFDVSDTILVQGVYGYDATGTEQSREELVLYVISRDDSSGLKVQAVNGKKIGNVEGCVPSIDEGTPLIRMGRAATELDVMSPQFEALPHKAQQFCQIFKMQVEQSTLQKLSNKEVPWTMTDQEEAAIYDMRLGMEKSFLFGVKGKIWDNAKKEYVMLTGGIWKQAGKEFAYNAQSINQESIIDMMRKAFTGNAGSKRKILIGGSELIGTINKLDYQRVITASDTITKWGIDFTELRSKFGTLYVLLSEVFDECGMAANGMIIDPEYLQKYVHQPFSAETLNLKASGVRNVDATVLSETSCLVLRYPKAHMRIVKA
ncbi:MAG: DUF5309 family protein [Muribaculaceae bacterium]|nr:DUF5309 family protein [Muribaculaceae bacterium]